MTSKKFQDPFAAREAERYEHPIASREAILQFLRQSDRPLSRVQIARELGMSHKEQTVALERRLGAMVRDGQLQAEGRRYQAIVTAHSSVAELIDGVIGEHNLRVEWPEGIARAVAKLPETPDSSKLGSRVDLRHLAFVTIDGEDAKDFDDAVYAEAKPKGGWRLWVAIADVSFYVKPKGALDQEAQVRGNSVYFPGRVLPMLPEELSNGLCSLKPAVDRFCLVAEMEISAAGELGTFRFYEAVIHSQGRLTYSQVARWLKAEQIEQATAGLLPKLHTLYDLYHALYRNREERGALEIDAVETRVGFNAEGQVTHIVPVHRNDAHRLIEECMLVANVAAAQYLLGAEQPGVYRIHAKPDPLKVQDLRQFLSLRGLILKGGEHPHTAAFNEVLQHAKTHPDANVIQTMVLRTMQQAVYSADCIGHFGLAYEAYTHFTSPIRRYADLLVHRQIKAVIAKAPAPYSQAELEPICQQVSTTERTADQASRDATQALKCVYLAQHVGSEFEVVVSGVTAFGLFATISDWMIDGLIHVRTLRDDYYHYDSQSQTLTGERGGQVFYLGKVLRVRVAKVDVAQGRIDFEWLRDPATRKRREAEQRAYAAREGDVAVKPVKGAKKTAQAALEKKAASKKAPAKAPTRRGKASVKVAPAASKAKAKSQSKPKSQSKSKSKSKAIAKSSAESTAKTTVQARKKTSSAKAKTKQGTAPAKRSRRSRKPV